MNPKKETDVSIAVLQVIYVTVDSIAPRLDSLVKDYYYDNLNLSDSEYALLMELRTSCATLSCLLEEYISQGSEYNVDKITLPMAEFRLLIELSKTVELSTRSTIGPVALWTH